MLMQSAIPGCWYRSRVYEEAEDPRECLERELAEETGLRAPAIGPRVGFREHTFRWDGKSVTQLEDYYLVETAHFEPTMEHNPEPREVAAFIEFRWWRCDEIERSEDLFVPGKIAAFARSIAEHGPPSIPVDVGI